MLLHVIADFGRGDLAFAEVSQRLKRVLPEAEVVCTPVPPFATLAAGFAAAQLALNPAPEGMVVFHNVAPRRDDDAPRADNAGERLACAELPNGVQVIGVHAGHAFSFLREAGARMRYVTVDAAGSQFRSRDLFPQALAAVVHGREGALAEEVPDAAVPPVPEGRIAYVDGFGNLKTTLRAPGGWTPGATVGVRVGAEERDVVVSGGSFSVPSGTLTLAPGSSGWPLSGGATVRWMELFLRGGSAAERFGRPPVGSAVTVLPRAVPT